MEFRSLKRKAHTIDLKIEVIDKYEEGKNTTRELAYHYNVPQSCISKWVNNGKKLRREALKDRKRAKTEGYSQYSEVEKHVVQWFISARSMGIALSAESIQLQAFKLRGN